MPDGVQTKPVEDLGHKIDNTISVGEDLQFQETWWKFENFVWSFFAILLVLDLLGVFGRGWFAREQVTTPDGQLHIKYERIERTMTPAALEVGFGSGAASEGKYKLFVSSSLINELGNQRIAPQPESSEVGSGGVTYTFPASTLPATISLSLEPASPGIYHFQMGVPGGQMLDRRVVVVP